MVDVSPTPAQPAKRPFPWGLVVKIIAAVAVAVQPVIGHYQADAKKGEAVQESAKNTFKAKDELYEEVAATQIKHTAVLKIALDKIAHLAVEQAQLAERIAASEKLARRTPGTAKVKVALAAAKKNLKAIKEDANAVKDALVPPPATLPPPKDPKTAPTTASPQDAKSP